MTDHLLHQPCGARLGSVLHVHGFLHVLTFIDLDTDDDVTQCPRCGTNLESALHAGEMLDTAGSP